MVRRYVVDNGINCKALHEPVKLFSCHGAKVIGITRPGKVTAFNTLIKKQKTITFPEKTFDTICSLTTEQKERIFIVILLNLAYRFGGISNIVRSLNQTNALTPIYTP